MTTGREVAETEALSGSGSDALRAGNERIVVAGAGGWLGRATLELLHQTLGGDFYDRVVCFGSRARQFSLRGGVRVDQHPLSELERLSYRPSLVLHFAFLTQEKANLMSQEAYRLANSEISGQVFGALGRIGARGVILASSGAVYLADNPSADPARRLYGQMKLMDEAKLKEWAKATGAQAVTARIFNVAGPYINKRSSYALACFIDDVLSDRPIVIKASKPVYRSYVAIADVMSLAFGLLADPPAVVVGFDTAGEMEQELFEVASTVRSVLGGTHGIDRPDLKSIESDRYVGKREPYESLLRKFDVKETSFPDQIRHTARFMATWPEAPP